MSQDPLTDAATKLAELLAEENIALQALDYAAAGRMLAAKRAATEALTAAQAGTLFAPAGMRELAARLNELADENKTLLERAIIVQRRVLGTVAQAARTAQPEPHYGPGGAVASRVPSPLAFRANA